jgi:DNA-binding transcriptional LysR family regulator
VFRVAVLALPALISTVFAGVHAVAPNIGLEWLPVFPDTAAKVADGQIDLTLMPAAGPLPDGLSEHVLAADRRYTFARKGHPALSCWSREAWLRWPHVVVGMYSGARQTVEERMVSLGLERQIGARIPDFSGIGPLLANSDMLANQIGLTVLGDLDVYDLQVLETPADLPDITFRFMWSARLANDPGIRWLRALMIGSYEDLQAKVAARLAKADVIRPVA